MGYGLYKGWWWMMSLQEGVLLEKKDRFENG